jgi:hypothetical protein
MARPSRLRSFAPFAPLLPFAPSSFASFAASVLVASTMAACDLDCGGVDEPPPGLTPGAPLDDDIVLLVDELRSAAEDPPEITRIAVESALMHTGFGIRYEGDFIVVDDSKPQGIVFEPWDIDTIAVGMHQGIGITLDDYAAVWEALVPGAIAADIKAALLADIAAAADSDAPAQRAYAQLLVGLGRGSATGYDLLDPNVDGAAPLDAFQQGLLTFRLAGELWQSVRNEDGSPSSTSQGLEGPAPCTQTDTEGLVMDSTALVASTVWGGVLGHLADKGNVGAERFSMSTQVANAALVYAKLVWTMAVFRVDMEVDPQPLERTLSTSSAGADATVTATFRLDGTGKAQILNCMRIALNAMNLDFSVPQDGPLAGKRVEWSVVARGKDDVIQTASGDILHKETSSTGTSEIVVQGKEQQKSLEGKPTIEVVRRPVVHATTNLKNKDFVQDMIDVAAGVGGLGALWGMPAELLNRMPLLFNGAKTVVVNDHKELIGDHFQIVGEYEDLPGGYAVNAKEVRDSFVANVEVTIANDELTVEMLGWNDTATQYTDDYEPTGPGGEGCTQVTTMFGEEEVFTSSQRERVEGVYLPGANAGEDMAYVAITVLGYSKKRGYHIETDSPSCTEFDLEPAVGQTMLFVAFDSSMFSGIGTSTEVDSRTSDGVGWRYTITYVE